jgi:RNA polymerase sigma-70 factor, ECF subfamily
MDADARLDGLGLDQHWGWLCLLARLHLDPRLRGLVDPEDVVQDTFTMAHAARDTIRAQSRGELVNWLRKTLINKLYELSRYHASQKRDVGLQRSLDLSRAESSSRWSAVLADSASSPSQRAERHEELVRLAAALNRLPCDQQTAVELHHLQGYSVGETAQMLGCSKSAAAGLIFRGLRRLRALLTEREGVE